MGSRSCSLRETAALHAPPTRTVSRQSAMTSTRMVQEAEQLTAKVEAPLGNAPSHMLRHQAPPCGPRVGELPHPFAWIEPRQFPMICTRLWICARPDALGGGAALGLRYSTGGMTDSPHGSPFDSELDVAIRELRCDDNHGTGATHPRSRVPGRQRARAALTAGLGCVMLDAACFDVYPGAVA